MLGLETRDEKCADRKECEIDPVYDAFVNELAERRDPKVISNRSSSHALSILRNVFKYAKSEVNIFTGELDPCVYNDKVLLEYAENFVGKGGKIKVILQNEIPQERMEAPQDFYNFAVSKGEIKLADEKHPLKKIEKHFLVSDCMAYRLELNIEERSAVCSFNDEHHASQLNDIFNAAWASAAVKPIKNPSLAASPS